MLLIFDLCATEDKLYYEKIVKCLASPVIIRNLVSLFPVDYCTVPSSIWEV